MVRRAAALLAVAGVALALAACGGDGNDGGDPRPVRVERLYAGGGETGAWVFRRSDLRGRRLPVVLFVHGWGAFDPGLYGGWIEHLARAGNEVIFPRYQSSLVEPPSRVLGNLTLGVRRALALPQAPARRDGLVAVGHSAGGALVADYAAAAPSLGLPVPVAIMPVFPGRAIEDGPPLITEVPGRRIPPTVRILAMVGSRDDVVRPGWARRIVRTATRVPASRRTLRVVTRPVVSEHRGPLLDGPASRQAFWGPLDRLIRTSR